MTRRAWAICCCAVLLILGAAAEAKDQTASIVIRAGKTDSPNHALAVQFAEALAVALNGAYTLDVQESQGSIRNVMDAGKAQANYLFTAGPNVIDAARRGQKPFAPDPSYRAIRALFPIPAQTVHWVVRKDSAIVSLYDLAGKGFITGGKGGVSERVTSEALGALGADSEVQLMAVDTAAAPAALKSGQVAGFAIAGAWPIPAVLDLARATPIRLLSMPQPQLGRALAADDSIAAEIVPKSAYPGLDDDATTLALPAGVYTTTRMRDATAYAVVKAFWSQHDALIKRDPPWQAVNIAELATLGVRLHAGALRYYRDAGIPVPKALR